MEQVDSTRFSPGAPAATSWPVPSHPPSAVRATSFDPRGGPAPYGLTHQHFHSPLQNENGVRSLPQDPLHPQPDPTQPQVSHHYSSLGKGAHRHLAPLGARRNGGPDEDQVRATISIHVW